MKARKIGRLLSALLTLAMLLTLLPMSAFAATAGAEITVYKTDRDGNPLEGAHFTLVQKYTA